MLTEIEKERIRRTANNMGPGLLSQEEIDTGLRVFGLDKSNLRRWDLNGEDIEASLLDEVKTLVGISPITKAYVDKISADGYAPNASKAASLAKSLG